MSHFLTICPHKHLLPKISMFCGLSQNYQHFFQKNNACILKQIVQGTQNGIELLVGQVVFKLWIKTVK